jgi:hypothetical protein
MVEFMDRIDAHGDLDRATVWSNREFYLGVGRIFVLGTMIALSLLLIRDSGDLVYLLPAFSLYSLTYLGLPHTPPGGPRPATARTA